MPELDNEGLNPTDETPLTGDTQADGQTPDAEKTELNAEQLMAELKKTRREAAKYRTQLRKAEEAEAERQRAEMSELERLKADLEKAQREQVEALARANAQAVRAAVVAAAGKAGFADPADAATFIDADALTVQDDGTVEGVDEAIAELAKQKPYLLKPTPAGQPGATNPSRSSIGKSDAEMRAELFGGRDAAVWDGGVKIYKR